MKNKIGGIIIKIFVILLIIAFLFLGVFLYSKAEENTEKTSKIETELDYLDTKITILLNNLNGINLQNYKISISKVEETESSSLGKSSEKESSKKEEGQEDEESKEETTISKMEEQQTATEENINWSLIQGNTEILFSVWASMVLDLYDIGVETEKIVGFSNTLDQAVIAIKNEDKKMSIGYLARLYNFIPEFVNKSDLKDLKKKVIQTKNYIINAYGYVQDEEWERVQSEIIEAEKEITKIMNNIGSEEEQKEYSINKTYILIEELKNSLSIKDTGIFYIKYKNLIEEINTLM